MILKVNINIFEAYKKTVKTFFYNFFSVYENVK